MPVAVEAIVPPYRLEETVKGKLKLGELQFPFNAKERLNYIGKVKAELLKLGCSEKEIAQILTEEVIQNAMKNAFSPEAVAWALVQ